VRLEPTTPNGEPIPESLHAADDHGELRFVGALTKADQGSPVFDHAGVVWGVVIQGGRAVWSTYAMDRYVSWFEAGIIRDMVAQSTGEKR
jgi:hypothetical protein